MANSKPPTPTSPAPSLKVPAAKATTVPLLTSKLSQLINQLKTNRITQITVIGLFILVVLVTLSLAFITRSRSQLKYTQPPIAIPEPSPRTTTRFAQDPSVLEAEASIATVEAELKTLDILNHPLLPPTLDLQVTLEE